MVTMSSAQYRMFIIQMVVILMIYFLIQGCKNTSDSGLSAPSNLAATTGGTDSINLTWEDNSDNEDGFKLERSSRGGNFNEIASISANTTSYSDTGLDSSTTYVYQIKAYNNSGSSDYSSTAEATTSTPASPSSPPSVPSSLSATAGGTDTIELTWNDNSDNEDGFRIERSTGGGSYYEIASVSANVTTYSNTGLTSGTTYTYRVKAFNSTGSSDYSDSAEATTSTPASSPEAPSELSATTGGTDSINLTWHDNSSNEDGFKIERSTGGGSYSEIASVSANVTTYSNAGLTSATTYTYRVRAYNSTGSSEYSNTAEATTSTPASSPEAPSDLFATADGTDEINLTWHDNSSNEDGFRIERSAGGGSYSVLESVNANSTSYADTGLTAGTTYSYRVYAYNSAGNSSNSNTDSATTAQQSSGALIINHSCTDLNAIPTSWINQAKSSLHIAYGHTSHGSQLTTGMTGLVSFKGNLYAYNTGGTGGALDLRDTPFSGASDLGNPNYTAWATATRTYLNVHPEVNVIIWSWCGQADTNETNINTYLTLMDDLEQDYPDVSFVYMTGHLVGSGLTGNLHLRNDQIRNFCTTNNKILYDFEDIESYDPDGVYYGDKIPNDNCDYDSDNNGSRDKNWALDWQNSHVQNVDWYSCSSAHSQALNANQKAYAAWWLWARLAGWDGQ